MSFFGVKHKCLRCASRFRLERLNHEELVYIPMCLLCLQVESGPGIHQHNTNACLPSLHPQKTSRYAKFSKTFEDTVPKVEVILWERKGLGWQQDFHGNVGRQFQSKTFCTVLELLNSIIDYERRFCTPGWYDMIWDEKCDADHALIVRDFRVHLIGSWFGCLNTGGFIEGSAFLACDSRLQVHTHPSGEVQWWRDIKHAAPCDASRCMRVSLSPLLLKKIPFRQCRDLDFQCKDLDFHYSHHCALIS